MFLSTRTYTFLFSLLLLAYLPGLFVPLMDNDSAHHATIALHMHLTGDYASLVDHTGDYLDKPHLLFWLCAFSYKLFGVTTFAYKFPSFLFTILGTYSTFRLGKALYNTETGRLSALIAASSFAYILANNDVRMDAILTASIAFASWHLVAFVQRKKIINVAGAALGLALGFSTKGHIGVMIPLAGAFFYILYLQDWKIFLNLKWLAMLLIFAMLISPVLYSYYLQFNLHPEKVVRGRDHINGVKFILWDQNFERFEGSSFGKHGRRDNLFFFHSFLWAFCPWCVLAFIAIVLRWKKLLSRKQEWFTTGMFTIVMAGISFSGFKLPHYLNVIFPVASIMVASLILGIGNDNRWPSRIWMIQVSISLFLFAGVLFLNVWAFPVTTAWIWFVIISLAMLFYLYVNSKFTPLQKAIIVSTAAMIICFFALNTNFYFQLLKYQGGNELAFQTEKKVNPQQVYLWDKFYTPSWNFYTSTNRKYFDRQNYRPGKKVWLLFDSRDLPKIEEAGFKLGKYFTTPDYSVTKLKLSFIDPRTRSETCSDMILAEILSSRDENESLSLNKR